MEPEEDVHEEDIREEEEEETLQEEESDQKDESQHNDKTKYKYGVIYLSYIPDGLNVSILRGIMEEFGEISKIYLEPESANRKRYSEGWIEFKKKRVAKHVAKMLNGTSLQYGRKNSKVNGQVWSIKYLHRFKWAHLTEQLRHDKAVRDQKRRFEMTQAKKQADFYQKMTERSRYMKRIRAKDKAPKEEDNSERVKLKQKRPISSGSEMAVSIGEDLLGSIFKKVED